jgi:hypothetical protein
MFLPLPYLLVTAPLIIGVAERIPSFNLKPTCGTSDICTKSETAARDDLANQWTQFPAADRTRCIKLATTSGMPSYVQVLTCLEMARQIRDLNAPAAR